MIGLQIESLGSLRLEQLVGVNDDQGCISLHACRGTLCDLSLVFLCCVFQINGT